MLWLHCLPERLDSCQFCEQSTCGGCEHVPISATRLSALVSTISETPLSAMVLTMYFDSTLYRHRRIVVEVTTADPICLCICHAACVFKAGKQYV
eukprot:7610731-Pyramimonas_sp.AAC.1